MPDTVNKETTPALKPHHKGRGSQVWIYLGKQLRFFINESDWKVLPMAAVIAALVGMVVRKSFFVTMEGSLIGAFAMTCTAIWNGCFNSIQSICRERAIIKREHRSGMHISSYIAAHMIYQLLLCLAQSVLTMYVLMLVGVKFPEKGFMTSWMMLDLGITMLLISYAADMLSLLISSFAHTTTGAMTVMPFILIFQLIFSGGVIPLPKWAEPISNFTISTYGIRAIAAQSGYNEMPMVSVWNTVEEMREEEISGSFTLGQALDLLDTPAVEKRRDMELISPVTVGKVAELLGVADYVSEESKETVLMQPLTLGTLADIVKTYPLPEEMREKSFTYSVTIDDLFDLFGEENIKEIIQQRTAAAAYKPEFEQSRVNIVRNWLSLGGFIVLFAGLALLVLEFIDKDKR